jgi:hypothetical protein
MIGFHLGHLITDKAGAWIFESLNAMIQKIIAPPVAGHSTLTIKAI